MTGVPSREVESTISEINFREKMAIAPVLAIIIALGFVPQVVLNVVNPAVERVMVQVEAKDPSPTEVGE
jgi:NADH-quinone oxidoreductase subunit M